MRRFLPAALAVTLAAFLGGGWLAAQQAGGGGKAGGEGKEAKAGQEGGGAMSSVTAAAVETIKGKVLPIAAEVHKLPGGLTVVLVPYDSPGLAAYYTAMRVGSRDEVEPGHSGFAHLFEHIMFRGTKNMPGAVYDNAVMSMGADSSAWTWNDQTVFFFVAPRDKLGKVIEMEAERFKNLSYGESEFKTETGAVLGEYYKNFSNPINHLEEVMWDKAFQKHTYKHTTMGFLKDIKAMPTMYKYSLEFFKRHYVPGKAVLFVVGDFDKAQVLTDVEKSYADWSGEPYATPAPVEPPQGKEIRVHVPWKNPVLPMMLMGYKIPAYGAASKETAALALAGEMLFGRTGPLYKKLILDEQSAEKIEHWDWILRDPALFIVEARLKKEDFDHVIRLTDEEAGKLATGDFSKERLEDARAHYKYALLLGLETAQDVAQQLAFYATLDGDPMSLDKFLQSVDEVTADDLARVAGTFLVPARRTVATLTYAAAGGGKEPKKAEGEK